MSDGPRDFMRLKCKKCERLFESTFTAEEFALLNEKQFESGTLHLCPYCGEIRSYILSDYIDAKEGIR